jgi:hypothetical protein
VLEIDPSGSVLSSRLPNHLSTAARTRQGCVGLLTRRCDRPAPGRSVDSENDPSMIVFVAEVHEDRVPLVLHANAVIVIVLVMKDPHS